MSIVRVIEKETKLTVEQYDGFARFGEIIIDIGTNPKKPTIAGIGNDEGNIIPLNTSITDRLITGSEEVVLGTDGFLTVPNDVRQGVTDQVIATPGAATVIYTATTTTVNACKLFVHGVGSESGTDTPADWQTQACEVIVVGPYDRTAVGAQSKLTMYGIIHSSVNALFSLTSQIQPDGRLQVLLTPNSPTFPVRVKVAATEVSSS